jgi:hypothetical protein
MWQPADDNGRNILRRPPPPRRESVRPPVWAMALPAVLAILGIAGGWVFWRTVPPETPRQIVSPPDTTPIGAAKTETDRPANTAVPVLVSPTAPTANAVPEATRGAAIPAVPTFRFESANEQHMLDHVETESGHEITVFRFKPNPRILVLDFASLREQGRMLNRAAALVEKTGLPRDRLLGDAELETAVRAAGDTVETFYYGHDYGAASLVRFFSLADRENVRLSDEEQALHRLLAREGWFGPKPRGGLITIPQVGADEHVTKRARATILHHELSHGEYFTNPAYAAFVHRFWKQTLTEAEREQIRSRLHSLGYDPAQDDLMENEAQAYLMFTDDAAFFTPDMIGMSSRRLAELRSGFHRSMPAGWLRDSLGAALGANEAGGSHH